jgi:hypothetical protein
VLSVVVERGARLEVDGKLVSLRHGAFERRWDRAPLRPVHVRAIDALGNVNERYIDFVFALPGAEGHPPMRGVHVTAAAWATPSLREPILELIEAGRINTVQLDIKDEAGKVGYASSVPLAQQIGAIQAHYDLVSTIDFLHRKGVRVVGRIVNFRDPTLAKWALAHNHPELVVQSPDGTPYESKYGGYTNFAHPTVRKYNIDLAAEAAFAGMDDILYDYVRRPDGPIEKMAFPGLQGTPEDAIVGFLADSFVAMRRAGARLGASVFGIAATRPEQIAQDIPRMARHLDYVAPMLYPSHWARGEYNVANPNRQPYDIVRRSLADFNVAVAGTDVQVVPWLQDFSLGGFYGPQEVRAQLRAAADAGNPGFLLWNARSTYTAGALEPR